MHARSLLLLCSLLLACAAKSLSSPTADLESVVQGVYTPNPSEDELLATAAAAIGQDGMSVIGFCVDTAGRTVDVHVIYGFLWDPAVDEILLRTIKKWRFLPFIMNGRPTKICTSRMFRLRFR